MVRLRLVPILLSMVALMSLAVGAAAEEATPGDMMMHGGDHPAHIHAGTCAELDPNPAYPLNNVAQVEGSEVATSTITVEATLDELLASPYAINAHESADNIDNYVSCGDIVGPVVDGQLLVPLWAQNDSGINGLAVLQTNDAGGTDVTVYLVYPAMDMMM